MIERVFNVILIGSGIVAFIVWVISLVKRDGVLKCDPKDCESCPFPGCDDKEEG